MKNWPVSGVGFFIIIMHSEGVQVVYLHKLYTQTRLLLGSQGPLRTCSHQCLRMTLSKVLSIGRPCQGRRALTMIG
ncbi:uncharacterized protein F4817DRAFT_12422 [Daldinia loculata]|uniref:uncharacterized protein n=1 Tax=Daldinia loculata TaxID=103429 RepID=UPI0020C4D18E|nr:uncharacterized protein F4817DRAFT_12422 [Daldinia loculata]KAI1649684.1 hypothetical protein F4817DRAFT_12422 [Daldinia loculata]